MLVPGCAPPNYAPYPPLLGERCSAILCREGTIWPPPETWELPGGGVRSETAAIPPRYHVFHSSPTTVNGKNRGVWCRCLSPPLSCVFFSSHDGASGSRKEESDRCLMGVTPTNVTRGGRREGGDGVKLDGRQTVAAISAGGEGGRWDGFR